MKIGNRANKTLPFLKGISAGLDLHNPFQQKSFGFSFDFQGLIQTQAGNHAGDKRQQRH